jgi:amino acid adenylation domain-containing protein
MTDVVKRLQELSPERRRLLELRLKLQKEAAAGPELRPHPRPDGTVPLSFAQARLWVLDRMEPGSAAYNMPHPLRIRGPLDTGALARALGVLRDRHETLRTTFAEREGGPVQVIGDRGQGTGDRGNGAGSFELPVVDLSDLSDGEREGEVRRRVDADANTGFDLVAGPLVRASLLRLSADEHVLLLCMHHIVSDGWSMGVFAGELGEAYAALKDGREPHLPPLPLQYADFAVWQRERLRGEELERLAAFWRGALEDAPAALELPADHPRPAAPSHRGRTLKTRIAPDLAARLRELARAEGATLFNVLTAAARAVLARHAAQDDVVLGTPVANRQRSELEGLVGFFVNTLPLRSRVPAGESFRRLVHREKTVALAAFNHQDLPFDRIVEELRIARDPGRNPVFQAMVTLQNARMDPVALGGVEITPLAPEYDTAKFDLTLDHYEEDDGAVRMEAEWATDLFDEPTVAAIVRHVHALLGEAVARPDAPLRELAGGDEEERRLVLRGVNATAAEYERETAIHRLFEARAAESPAASAVEFGDASLTYAELDARATRLARRLAARGIGVESRVGVAMERSAGLVTAMLAVLKAGAAYVPLDPSYPAERLAFMLEDAGVSALVVAGSVPAALASFAGPVLSVDDDGDTDAPASPDLPEEVPADALAYVVYTSGSTGQPKGIGIPHRAVVRLVRNTPYVPFGPGLRIAQASNASFDAITFEVWGALLNGGTVVGLDRDTTLEPETLAAALRERRVGAAFLTTALFNQVARRVPDGFAPLSHLLFGGEAVDPAAVRAVLEAGGPARLLHVYGPTESTTYATWHRVAAVAEDAATVPIGAPLANTAAYVVDADGRACNPGEPGELLLGGDGLARGYLGRPALTAEKFVPDPFSGAPGARLYRTGDRVRWKYESTEVRKYESADPREHAASRDDDSRRGEAPVLSYSRTLVLDFLGRIDAQVKIRGFRIEPGEVEAALRAVAGVRDAAVVVRGDGGDRRLVAYFVPAGGALSPEALRDALAARLPDYMVPGAFVALNAIPVTPNGKVDRRALPEPGAAAPGEAAAPATPTEAALAEIWAEVLGGGPPSVEGDFFLLGGHSLLATQVVARIRRALGVEMPLRAVFEAPTIRRLAARVDALRGDGPAPLPPVVAVDRDRPLPLSFGQERLWFLERMEPEAGVYNMPVRIRLRGKIDAGALRRALETVVHRHEALRTLVREEGDAPVQVVAPPSPFDLPLVVAADEAEALRVLDEEAWRPIDLERGPATRALLVRIGPDEHVLSLNVHHALADGWSLGIMLREASAAYAAFAEGREPALDGVPLQYGDFAAWQRKHLSGERLDALARWWRERLADAPPLLELPTDRPRPARQSHRGAALAVHLPAPLARRVKELAAREGATPFMALLAAFQALLGRLARTDDVVVGTPVAGRGHAETEGVVGLFVNTLALRADLSGDPTFRALLRQVRDATLAAFAHPDLPFEKLVEALNVERSLSHAPVFQAMFELNSQETGNLALPGVQAGYDELERRAAKFDLTLSLEETAGGALEGALEYVTDLFDRDTAERMMERFRLLLDAMAADPDARLSAAEALLPGEREQLERWSDGGPAAAPLPGHALMERWAARMPDAAAVAFDGGEWTYAELDRRANRLARHLRALGAGPERVVAIMLERSPDQVAAVLAAWKAGAAYLPVDPAYPAERRAYMLEDSGACVVLTRAGLAGAVSAAARVETMDEAWAAADDLPDTSLGADVPPTALAYVIYTSGSTGRPKGVMVTHAGLANLAEGQCWGFGIERRMRVLQFASFSFDAALADLVSTLGNGATLVLAAPEALLPGRPLADTLRERAIEMVFLPPSAWAVLPEAELPALRSVISGGEACPPEVAARWSRGRRFVNAYGPTEATVCATCAEVGGVAARLPLGGPMQGMRVHVLDRGFRPAPIGVPGEICVAGVGVARGYLGRAALTAERFVPEPDAAIPGARMYRTGDLGRWTAAGELEYLGRLDHQVKLRGFRIELGEVEASLAALPGVREALALLRASPAGDARLVAYVTRTDEAEPDGAALRAELRRSLPEHMVPSDVVVLDAFPLTPNGKLDRAALPEPRRGAGAGAEAAPRTGTEQVLAEIWREVLGVPRVERGDGFFALGGHSLLATRVVSRIRAELRVDLPLREVFDAQTLESLAARVDAERARAGGVPDEPIPPAPRDRPLPLSSSQERFWFMQRLVPGGTAFNMPMLLWLRGALDAGVLARALAEIVRRHEALRTVFTRTAAGPVQTILPPAPVDLPLVDLTGETDPRAAARALLDRDAATPFDLERGPLLRIQLARTADDEHALVLGMHHVVGDAWSLERLYSELAALYRAFAAGEPSPLPDLPVQYADFAAWQRGWTAGERMRGQTAWWTRKLDGAPVLELPTDRPRRGVSALAGGNLETTLPRDTADRLEAVGHGEGATAFMTLLAVYCALLHRWSGQGEVVVGTAVAGRGRAELEPLIGPFVNALALRTDLSGDPTFRALLRRVRETTLDAYAHQDVPFEKLIEELNVERALGHHPVTQAAFTLTHESPVPHPPGMEITVDEVAGETGSAKVDLTLGIVRGEGALRCSWEYAADLFDAATIERQAQRFNAIAAAAAEAPDLPLSLLLARADAPQRERVLREWSGATHPYPRRPIHRLFAEQAARTPGAPAIAHAGGGATTYAELDAAANRLARLLVGRGVRPETRVGVVVDRTPEMVVAVLGVLKAGGAYVPLDPAYPVDRLRYMLADSAVPIVVSPSSSAASALPLEGTGLVALDREAEALAAESPDDPGVEVDEDNLAYVIYTSGSTGQPKGVLVPHRGIPNLVTSQVRRWGIGAGARVLQFASFSFDAAVSETFTALTTGATLVLATRDEMLPGAPLLDLLRRERISKVTLPPSVLAALPEGELPDLHTLVSAGEALGPALVDRWAPGREMHNAYGPTENTVGVATDRCVAGARPTIGRPFENVRAYVLDAALEPVPAGVPGELYAAGPGVARGYHGQPGRTATCFLPDPFGGEPGARMYRTGDRVRWLDDGRLQFMGRMDEQVKVRGFRIEPGEIVSLLTGVEGVRDAVVVVRGEAPHERLVAYVTGDGSHAPDPERLREHLRARVPEYMVPGAIVVLGELPLTPNGKVDRAALPEPAAPPAGAPPQGELERAIAAVWREVLGIGEVGVNDSFFEIGGHSLLLARLQEALEKALGREVALVDLFRHPTIRSFAASLDASASPEMGDDVLQPSAAKRGEDRGAARRAAMVRRR